MPPPTRDDLLSRRRAIPRHLRVWCGNPPLGPNAICVRTSRGRSGVSGLARGGRGGGVRGVSAPVVFLSPEGAQAVNGSIQIACALSGLS